MQGSGEINSATYSNYTATAAATATVVSSV
jgi:hypothetical protein